MATFLIGGGWSPGARPLVYGPFLAAAGPDPTVACVVFDEGEGSAQFDRWAQTLTATAPCTPRPVLVGEGEVLDVRAFADATAVLVCGGHTPSYAAALAPAASALASWLADGPRHYAGFSAGAAVASRRALVGGWRIDGVPVCPEDASEDLDEVAVVAGVGLVPFTVDVHAAQWGTLPRLAAAVGTGRAGSGCAIDEDTMLVVESGTARVAGLGRVHAVSVVGDALQVRTRRPGDAIDAQLIVTTTATDCEPLYPPAPE